VAQGLGVRLTGAAGVSPAVPHTSYRIPALLIAASALALLCAGGCCLCKRGASGGRKPPYTPGPPIWARDPIAPHPLPGPNKKPWPKDIPPADNFRCYVCHLNFEEEPLVSSHAKGGIKCEKCHGESDDHCGDENHATAPEILYPRDKIAPACLKCHLQVKTPPGFAPPPGADLTKTCSECHYSHRLERRLRVWDKATGKLIQ